MNKEDLARKILHAVLDDLTDRRGIRQSVLGEMYHIMRYGDEGDESLFEIAKECEETNIAAIVAILNDPSPTVTSQEEG
jgi:hypothetical protein